MRVTTRHMYQSAVNQMSRNQMLLNQTQNTIATGKRVNLPSDDPIGASQVVLLKERVSRTEALIKNSGSAKNSLETQETTIASAMNVLNRIRELQLQASNSTYNSADRRSIAVELQSKLDELVGIANTSDGKGSYLFSGYQTLTRPFVKNEQNEYVYMGDTGTRNLEIAPGMNIQLNDSGFDVFENIRAGDGHVMLRNPGIGNTGSGVVSDFGMSNHSQYVPDSYTLSFVTNADGQVGYQVIGAQTGQVIPASPATLPDSAPRYTPGDTIHFNGVDVRMTGNPQPGDSFVIEPSVGKSIFSSLQDFIGSLQTDVTTDSDKALALNNVTIGLMGIDQAMEKLSAVRTGIGARFNAVENAEALNADFKLSSESFISLIEDLDYAEAISNLDRQTLSLQASQQSFLRIQNLSLFSLL